MLSQRLVRHIALVLSGVAGLACGDYTSSTSPLSGYAGISGPVQIRSSFALVPSGSRARAVRWGAGHSNIEQTASATIGAEGGTLSIPNADFTLTVPAGALSAPTAITITAKRGVFVAYEMQPHGLRFAKPAVAVQGLRNTAVFGRPEGSSVRTGYLTDGDDQIASDDSAAPVELEAATTLLIGADRIAETHEWLVNHFSRYILISGVWTLVSE
jgi:hypothetical protein